MSIYDEMLKEVLLNYKVCIKCREQKVGKDFVRNIGMLPIDVCRKCNNKANKLKHSSSDKGREARAKYAKTEDGRESKRKTKQKYSQSKRGKDLAKIFRQTEKGKLIRKRKYEKIKADPIRVVKIKQRSKVWRVKNLQLRLANNAKRRAAKLQRTPPWANLKAIKQIYINCPKGYHVDHIIPLQGETVCGLHVENNLQYLLPSENSKKGNKIIYDLLEKTK